MTKLLLAVAAVFALNTVAFAEEGAAPAPAAPAVEQAPAGDAHKDMGKHHGKKDMKKKKDKKKAM